MESVGFANVVEVGSQSNSQEVSAASIIGGIRCLANPWEEIVLLLPGIFLCSHNTQCVKTAAEDSECCWIASQKNNEHFWRSEAPLLSNAALCTLLHVCYIPLYNVHYHV